MSAAVRPRTRGAAALLGLVVLLLAGTAPGAEPATWLRVLAWVLLVAVVALLLWLRRRDRVAYEKSLTEQAARAAVVEDRLAIARDLHDLVSGALGAITVRAAVAQRLETDAAGLRTALAEVEEASRAATADLRSMLAVLRGQGAVPAPAPVLGAPPLAAAVEQAADGARALGLEVRTEVLAADAGPAVRELALAVVREGLANAARHAGPVAVDVVVRAGAGVLSVEVVDDGPAPGWVPQPGTGTGLAALAERASSAGARLSAGPRGESGDRTRRGTGFRLSARIPLDAGAER